MKSQVLCLLLPVLAIAAGNVTTDYDRKVDFSRFRTYSWLGVKAGNSLWNDRIQADVDGQLAAKGWKRVASGGDVNVAAFGKLSEEENIQSFYNGFPGWGWQGWGGAGTVSTNAPERVGNLTVDLFDAQSKKLIWRGTASQTLSSKPEKNDKKVEKAVGEMFGHFPPKARG
jgi:hypothetical protein